MCPTMNNWYFVFGMLTISLSVMRNSLAYIPWIVSQLNTSPELLRIYCCGFPYPCRIVVGNVLTGQVQWQGVEMEYQLNYWQRKGELYTHCYGHSLNLAVQDAVKANPIIRDALDTIEEMSKLIKKSPRRQVIFQKVKNDIALDSPGIRLLCPTRWTVRAEAFTSILRTMTP